MLIFFVLFYFFVEIMRFFWYNEHRVKKGGNVRMDSQTLEYIIKCKNEGKVIRNKVFAILGYAFLFVTLALLIINLCAPLLHIPFLLVDTAFCAMTAFVSWKFLCVEFEIVIGGGELTLSFLFHKGKKHQLP